MMSGINVDVQQNLIRNAHGSTDLETIERLLKSSEQASSSIRGRSTKYDSFPAQDIPEEDNLEEEEEYEEEEVDDWEEEDGYFGEEGDDQEDEEEDDEAYEQENDAEYDEAYVTFYKARAKLQATVKSRRFTFPDKDPP